MRGRRQFTSSVMDFSGGVIGGLSEYGRRIRHVRVADNTFMRPAGAMRVRGGSQRLCSAVLPDQPHSLGEWLAASGANKLFAAAKSGASTGALYETTDSAFTAQTVPSALSEKLCVFDQLNDTIWMTQMAGALTPIFYRSDNPANTWHSMVLPKPTGTAPSTNNTAGGALTTGVTYNYRYRWRFQNGSSLVSAVFSQATAGANLTIGIGTAPGPGPNPLLHSSRSDYLGITLERTKQGGSTAGPFYLLTDLTPATNGYVDAKADADLFERTDETLHFEPQHYEGLIAHNNRLFGWLGSTLYASQAIGDEEATGLCNWPIITGAQENHAFDFGKDDGDTIQLVVTQQDRLIVLKRQSIWALEGNDLDSYRVVPIADGIGATGPRAACSYGGRVWIFGWTGTASPSTGLHLLSGNTLKPFGWIEVGHYVDQFSLALIGDIELIQYLGNYVLGSYSRGGTYNDEQIVYDQRFDNWTHFTNWRIRGALVQKGSNFGGATLIFCDPRNWPAFTKAGIAVGMTVTGPNIPGATTVSSVSADGTTVVLNNAATATTGPVTLTFGGSIAITSCWENSTTTITSKDYRIWQGFRGFKDEKAQAGTGGDQVPWSVQLPWVDDGQPDVFKDFSRMQFFAAADGETFNVSVEFDPPAPTASLSALVKNSAVVWGAFTWGSAAWATPTEAAFVSGMPEGSIARRWRARITGMLSGDAVVSGLMLDGSIEAERRFSNAGVPA